MTRRAGQPPLALIELLLLDAFLVAVSDASGHAPEPGLGNTQPSSPKADQALAGDGGVASAVVGRCRMRVDGTGACQGRPSPGSRSAASGFSLPRSHECRP